MTDRYADLAKRAADFEELVFRCELDGQLTQDKILVLRGRLDRLMEECVAINDAKTAFKLQQHVAPKLNSKVIMHYGEPIRAVELESAKQDERQHEITQKLTWRDDEILINTLDADRRRAVENIREAANRIWARPLHRYYTDHTVAHSERIIALMDGLTAGMMATYRHLAPTEIFVLLCAAYLHDIGMQNEKFAHADLEEIRAHHHEQSAEMMYKVFEDPANAFAIPLGRDPGLVEAIAQVSKGHRKVDLSAAEYNSFVQGGETLRLRLLTALLRFGDELDIDYRRVDLEMMKLMAIPPESQLH